MPDVQSQATFSDRLRELMTERDIGTPTLARVTGIPQRTIARYRSGESEPRGKGGPSDNARLIAEVLGVPADELLDGAPEAVA